MRYIKDASANACLLDDVLVMMAKHRKRCVTVADRRSLGAHPIGAVGDFVAIVLACFVSRKARPSAQPTGRPPVGPPNRPISG